MLDSVRRTFAVAVGFWLLSMPAWGGTLSNVSVTNNSVDGSESGGVPSCAQTRTSTSIVSQTSTSFSTRFQQSIAADARLTTAIDISQTASYTINFDALCPAGPYQLHVDTSLKGAFTHVDDSSGCGVAGTASSDLSGVSGSQSGGTLSDTLNLVDPGGENNNGARDVAFTRTASGTISNTSSGAAVAHSLTFTWTGSCASNASAFNCGVECAVRLGMQETFSPCGGTDSESADDYPGVNTRTAAEDGHFVSVSIECLCGNGTLDGGEACDDGALNGQTGSCCSSTCTVLPEFAACRPAASSCDLVEECNGFSGQCPTDLYRSMGSTCTTDGIECTNDVCDASGGCTHPPKALGTSCNSGGGSCDGSGACGPLLTPTSSPSATPTATPPVLCGATPLPDCSTPASEKSSLSVQYKPGRDRVKWKWSKGPAITNAEFGDPTTTTNYTLCVYETDAGSPSLAAAIRAPAGGLCYGKPCWRASPKGFKYSDRLATPDGMAKLTLKSGDAGRASIAAQAKDPNLTVPMPTGGNLLKQDSLVIVQLVNDLPTPGCWEARYSAPAGSNDFEKFKDRSN